MRLGPMGMALAVAALWAATPAVAQAQTLQLKDKVLECKIATVFRCTEDGGCKRQTPPAVLRIDFTQNNACVLGNDGRCQGNRLFKPFWRTTGTVGLNFGKRTLAYYITRKLKLVGAEARATKTFGVFGTCKIVK